MAENIAPTKQLLVTKDNVTQIVNRIYVKKKDIVNPEVVNSLRHLCDIVDKDTPDRKTPQRMLAIFLMRKEILENACEIYIENNEEVLFAEATDELQAILQIIEEHTITR